MWCGGIIYFDFRQGKQDVITFVHKSREEVLIGVAKEAIEQVFGLVFDENLWRTLLANGDQPEILFMKHGWFREYGHSVEDALKGWSFFINEL